MAWRCYMLAAVAMVFSVCFQTRVSCTNNVAGSATVCNTSECNSTASMMREKMNLSADPCQDFNEFACGRYIQDKVMPAGKAHVSTMEDLKEQNKLLLRDILNDTEHSQLEYLNKMRSFYRSCMNEDHIEAVGLSAYFNDSAFANDWPTLNRNWNDSNFDLNEVIERYMRAFVFPLFYITVDKDSADNTKHSIVIWDGKLGIEEKNYAEGRNNPNVRAYEKYLVDFAVALNATREVAVQDARQVVDLEIEISKIMLPSARKIDQSKLYNPLRLDQVSQLYPAVNVASAIRAIFSVVNITVPDNATITNLYPQYMKDLESVLACVSKRTILNLFGFKYALLTLEGLTRRLREIRQDFDRVYTGITSVSPRWMHCTDRTSTIFWQGMSKQFVTRHFSEAAKVKVNEMIDELKEEFRQMVEQASWMSSSAKETAYRKLTAIRRKVGYPSVDFDDDSINRIYENLSVSEGDFYNNQVNGIRLKTLENLASYSKPMDIHRFYLPPHDVDAYTILMSIEIVYLAGLLQAPFYSESSPDYLNYGAIGSAVGHEITHNFDSLGRDYDEHGNLRNWWTPEDHQNFDSRSSCFVNQYSGFRLDELNKTVNGEIAMIETLADIGGLKESFRAYKQHVLRHGQQPRLPHLNLSQDQLFFLSYAQMYCERMTPEKLLAHLSEVHPPGNFRIIGALQNSEDFATAYNCSPGSYMNPVKKCILW